MIYTMRIRFLWPKGNWFPTTWVCKQIYVPTTWVIQVHTHTPHLWLDAGYMLGYLMHSSSIQNRAQHTAQRCPGEMCCHFTHTHTHTTWHYCGFGCIRPEGEILNPSLGLDTLTWPRVKQILQSYRNTTWSRAPTPPTRYTHRIVGQGWTRLFCLTTNEAGLKARWH